MYVWLPPAVIAAVDGLNTRWSSAAAFTVRLAVPVLPLSVPVTVWWELASATVAVQLAPEQCLMVAAHASDLRAAAARGFRTAYVHRAHEFVSHVYARNTFVVCREGDGNAGFPIDLQRMVFSGDAQDHVIAREVDFNHHM